MNVIVLARSSALSAAQAHNWVTQLTRALRERGQTVALMDGSIASFPPKIERTWGHTLQVDAAWQAGAQELLLAHPQGAALLTRFEPEPEQQPPDLLGLMGLVDPRIDWVLALGFDQAGTHKLEAWSPEARERVLYPDDPFVAAIVSAEPASALPEATLRPVLPLHEPDVMADWLLQHAHRFDWHVQIGGAMAP